MRKLILLIFLLASCGTVYASWQNWNWLQWNWQGGNVNQGGGMGYINLGLSLTGPTTSMVGTNEALPSDALGLSLNNMNLTEVGGVTLGSVSPSLSLNNVSAAFGSEQLGSVSSALSLNNVSVAMTGSNVSLASIPMSLTLASTSEAANLNMASISASLTPTNPTASSVATAVTLASISPALSLNNVVASSSGGCSGSPPYTDSFTYSNGSLPTVSSGLWATPSYAQSFNVSSDTVVASTNNALNEAYYTCWSNGNDQCSTFTVANYTAGMSGGPMVRMSATTDTGYEAFAGGGYYKRVAGTETQLGTYTVLSTGDVLKICAIGTTITVLKNGTIISTTTDSSISTGYPGMRLTNTGGSALSSFVGSTN